MKHNGIHGDIKGANILLSFENGSYKACITDFGLTNKTGGTPGFMAPEGSTNRRIAKTDIYSLGITLLYSMVEWGLALRRVALVFKY